MTTISNIKKQNKLKLDMINMKNSETFYQYNLKCNIFRILYDNYELNMKLQSYYNKAMLLKRRKIYKKAFFKNIKESIIEKQQRYNDIFDSMLELKRV